MSKPLAIAVDLGTTTLAASLINRMGGQRLTRQGTLNPQRAFGADVVSRLAAACVDPAASAEMTTLIRDEFSRLAGSLLAEGGIDHSDVACVAIAGNPAMEHLLLGLPVRSLAFPPYRPAFTTGKTLPARELGFDWCEDAYLFPLPGGFVGGDLVSFLYGEGIEISPVPDNGFRLFLDIGTNGEIALACGTKIYATSAAAGPALEGGNLSCGMTALPGAISRVAIEGERVHLTVIGNRPPLGICGSAVLEALAELLAAGVIDVTGRLCSPAEMSTNLANRIVERDGAAAFILHRDARGEVVLTQEDIRQVQLAKGAIRAGIEVLCERAGIRSDTVQEVVLTGSFGVELSPQALKSIGILTENMVKSTRFVRDGALIGVEKALTSCCGIEEVEKLARAIQVIPLSGTPAFEKHFLSQINFPINS